MSSTYDSRKARSINLLLQALVFNIREREKLEPYDYVDDDDLCMMAISYWNMSEIWIAQKNGSLSFACVSFNKIKIYGKSEVKLKRAAMAWKLNEIEMKCEGFMQSIVSWY